MHVSKHGILSLIFYTLLALAAGATAQTHPLTVHPNHRVVHLQMMPTEYRSWKDNDDFAVNAKREALIKDIYASFKDEFDFIFLVLNEADIPDSLGYAGQLISVTQKTTGIGSGVFDYANRYGSGGRLKSIMALTKKDHILFGPSLHELMHTWGNFAISAGAYDPFGPGCCGGAMDDYQPHWGFTGGNTAGQLGGFVQSTLVGNVNGKTNRYRTGEFGQFANGGNSVPYSEFELYLMGMIPLSGVAPFDVFRDITAYDASTHEFEATTKVRYDNARILSELQARSPSQATSQKDFRLLIVVLSDAPLTDLEWKTYDKDSERFGMAADDGTFLYNFWEATGGKGTMETGKLNNALKVSGGLVENKPRRLTFNPFLSPEMMFNILGRRVEGEVRAAQNPF